MESEKFDELIKRMGTGRMSRLTALRGLAGGAAAVAAGMVLAKDEAEAGKKGRKAKRRKAKRRGNQQYVPPAPVAPVQPVPHPADPYTCQGYDKCPEGQIWDPYDHCKCKCGADHVICENDYESYKKGTCVSNKCDKGWHYEPSKCKCVKGGDGGDGGDGDDITVIEITCNGHVNFCEEKLANGTTRRSFACCEDGNSIQFCAASREEGVASGQICLQAGGSPVPPEPGDLGGACGLIGDDFVTCESGFCCGNADLDVGLCLEVLGLDTALLVCGALDLDVIEEDV